MDGKPFRATRPTGGRASSSPEPAQRQAAVPAAQQQVREDPVAAPRTAPRTRPVAQEDKSPKRILPWIIAVVALVVALGAGWFAWTSTKSAALVAVDSSKYQAVFFTNGQVYFGKLQAGGSGYMRMTDIYYLQNQGSTAEADPSNPQETSTDQNNVQLVKLGKEIHGPEDEMIISKDQVLFYENLKADGKVTQSIEKYKSSN